MYPFGCDCSGAAIKKEVTLCSNAGVDLPPDNQHRRDLETAEEELKGLLDESHGFLFCQPFL